MSEDQSTPGEASGLVSNTYFLQPGYIFVAVTPTQISTVLGSCVGVSLYDREHQFGGMNHFQLPIHADKSDSTARYGNVATVALIKMMLNEGSSLKRLEAQLLGGAHNPEISPRNIGRENVEVARKILAKAGIKLVSEDVGGEKGRKIVFNTSNNELAVIKVDKLRKSDWFPYEGDR
ncbi:MAG: chemotaxis protein CheD [Deltaproteobacteria bacterium]|nr:chemotaxis protein CheD [Deltaproteobacteria bacterium]